MGVQEVRGAVVALGEGENVNYEQFIASKRIVAQSDGFTPSVAPGGSAMIRTQRNGKPTRMVNGAAFFRFRTRIHWPLRDMLRWRQYFPKRGRRWP